MPANSTGLIEIVADVIGQTTHEYSTQDTAAHVSQIPSGGTLLRLPSSSPSDGDRYEFSDIDGSCGPSTPITLTDPNGHTIGGSSEPAFTSPFSWGVVRYNAKARTWALLSSGVGAAGGGILGTSTVGMASVTNALTAPVLVGAGDTVKLYTMSPDNIPASIGNGTGVIMIALVSFIAQNNSAQGRLTKLMTIHRRGGIITTPDGGTIDDDVTPATSNNVDPTLADVTASIVLDDSDPTAPTLEVFITAGALAIEACCAPSFLIQKSLTPLPPIPPTLDSITPNHGPTTGATPVAIFGAAGGFTNAYKVTLDGSPITSLHVVDDHNITGDSGTGSAGTGNVVVSTPSGDITGVGLWTYDAPTTPITIFTTALRGWGNNASIQEAAGLTTGWNDISGHAQNLSLSGSGAAPTFVASSTNITPNGPASRHDGTNKFYLQSAFDMAIASGSPFFTWVVVNSTDTTGWLAFLATLVGMSIGSAVAGDPDMAVLNAGGPISSGRNTVASTVLVMGYTDGTSGAGSTGWVAVNGGARVTRTGTASLTLTSPARFVVAGDLVLPAGDFFDWGVCNAQPTLLQQSELWSGYAQPTYGLAP